MAVAGLEGVDARFRTDIWGGEVDAETEARNLVWRVGQRERRVYGQVLRRSEILVVFLC